MGKKVLRAAMRERLLRSARKAMKNTDAPYSRFRVGAAILTSTGDVFLGRNVEKRATRLPLRHQRAHRPWFIG